MAEQRWYKYETHCHSNVSSLCGVASPEKLVHDYAAAGYTGLILTEHFLNGNTAVDRSIPDWREKMALYAQGYEYAKAAGDKIGFDVFFGVEFGSKTAKEFLTYGLDIEFYMDNPDLLEIPTEEYCARVHAAGGFVSMAHPYREAPYIVPGLHIDLSALDAMEVYNHCNSNPQWNEHAYQTALSHGLMMTSGSDDHTGALASQAGVAFPERISDAKELVQALRSGCSRLIIKGEFRYTGKGEVL